MLAAPAPRVVAGLRTPGGLPTTPSAGRRTRSGSWSVPACSIGARSSRSSPPRHGGPAEPGRGRPDHPLRANRRDPPPARAGGVALAELVRGYKTSDETLAAAKAFAEGVGKTTIVVNRDVAGFVTTRLITALVVESVKLMDSGVVSAEDLDTACKLAFGHPMGPLATADLTGVDILMHSTPQHL
jgi:3-hydroxyacyl-CoA dehydrogenase, C-terminal domain/3-hydroxyacyl-CoA dehydrogenase, NAD binding domain